MWERSILASLVSGSRNIVGEAFFEDAALERQYAVGQFEEVAVVRGDEHGPAGLMDEALDM